MRLGCLPHDPARVSAAPRLGARQQALVPPAVLRRDRIPFTPDLDQNDVLSDCTCVALANAARGVAALSGCGLSVPSDRVVQFFADTAGVPADQAAAVDGLVLLDVMDRQKSVGLDTGNQVLLTGPYATIDPGHLALLQASMAFIGLPILGVALSVSDQNMLVWDTEAPASAGDPAPGSWGLHGLISWDYTDLSDTGLVRLGTWGGWKQATWRWLKQRMCEVHVVVFPNLMPAASLQWAGLDRAHLAADLSALG